MSQLLDGQSIKTALLEVIEGFQKGGPGQFQQGSILQQTANNLGISRNVEKEQMLLTVWADLFRTGYLAWGYDLNNTNPPFCHVTSNGRDLLKHLSVDPFNSDGYLSNLSNIQNLNQIAKSYIEESLKTFNNNCYKAAAIMVGAASESIILELRDALISKIDTLGISPPSKLKDWRIKTIFDSMKNLLDNKKINMPARLKDNYEVYYPTFTQQIRVGRNDAGHPNSIEPVTSEQVHSSLLIFPELCKIAYELKEWITNSYT